MSGMYKEQQKSTLIEEEGNKTKIRDITGGFFGLSGLRNYLAPTLNEMRSH